MSHGLSKSRITSNRQCPKRLWLTVNRRDLLDDTATKAAMETGHKVGAIAQSLVPDGVLIDIKDLRIALHQTTLALAAKPRRPIFEATVQHAGVLVQADVLIPQGRRWRMVEVKSSARVKDNQVEDAAIQSWVFRQAGVPLCGEGIAHINTAFVYPGGDNYDGLLIEQHQSDAVAALQPQVPQWIDAARKTLSMKREPKIEPGAQCTDPFPCPFQAHCILPQEGYPVHILPHGGKLVAQLQAEGYADLRDVPQARLTNPRHVRVWAATRSGKPYIDASLRETLRALPYPRIYIDFETLNPAIPLWAGTRPYQQVPFQWSCHIQQADGSVEHQAFLAEGHDDPRPKFIRTLLDAVGKTGPVLVWNQTFEKSRLRELAEMYPQLATKIQKLIGRMVDLWPLVREHYYHPDMRGSWSIKDVLPTIAPDLAYDDLEVAGGMMAQEAFRHILSQKIDADQRESKRKSLLAYCERDTLAMVRVVEFLR
ncbi:conserved hypothetical protein [Thiomonas sp. X19]|uniref:DUF2779 domain-containing protein n=1 Tax=Thiomonas sp. X19 TaxID=1050370 RepID=UPI000B6FCDAF|nr:DUF2779 domain-containing protein [Thiomonas sp. X19]SCC93597.1 conserved hypothetical protein [Thiomonas sp. X19]SCC94710.1 conserved hypothetical protein [Thiomonas sp. X19]